MTASSREATLTDETRDSLVYVYAVMQASDLQRCLAGSPLSGIDAAGEVTAIEAGPLAAAVSQVPASTFLEEPLNELVRDLARLAPYAVAHESVIRSLADGPDPVIPLAFGTVYRSPAAVRGWMAGRRVELSRLLSQMRGAREWTVKVLVDMAVLAEASIEQSERLRTIAADAGSAERGRAYLLRRQMDRLSGAESERLVADAVERLRRQLMSVCVAVQPDEVAPAPAPTPVQLAAKLAVLVKRDLEEELAELIASCEAELSPLGISLEVTGPWAPYSFVNLNRA